jgi:hypothetical protein
MDFYQAKKAHNNALHRTAIPLRSIAAVELGHSSPSLRFFRNPSDASVGGVINTLSGFKARFEF